MYPTATLDNGHLRVQLYLPEPDRGFYRGPRFDGAGVIKQVDHAGHRFYAPLHRDHDPRVHDAISGPASEFGMSEPMGFAEAQPGETFVKIGVGLLRKEGEAKYAFDHPYEIVQPGRWQVDLGPTEARFEQSLTGERGWAYRYVKVVRLVPGRPELILDHLLENTGQKTIDLDHYNHNFTVIDGQPYGPGYTVRFPFATDTPRPINGLAHFRGDRIEVDRPLGDGSLWIPVLEGGGSVADNAATVRNDETGAFVAFQGDTPITKMVFWAVEAAACPEPFIALTLAPGEQKRWSIRYTYGVDRPR